MHIYYSINIMLVLYYYYYLYTITNYILTILYTYIYTLYCIYYSGVLLKWLSTEHLYITPGGRLQVGGLSGAVMADTLTTAQTKSSSGYIYGVHSSNTTTSTTTNSSIEADDPFSLIALSNQISIIKNNNRVTKTDISSTNKSRMKRKYNIDDEEDDEEVQQSSDRIEAKMLNILRKMALPRSVLYTVAPEVLLGAAASPESTVYTVCTVAVQILTGRALIKVSGTL